MNTDDKQKAEKLLRYFFVGSQIVGVHWFQSSIYINIEAFNTSHVEIKMQEFVLMVESRWMIFPCQPGRFPKQVEELPDFSLEERVARLARLANQNIVDVMLGEEHPHLFLIFESGSIFFLWGYHEMYESWNISSPLAEEQFSWIIFAVSGSRIVIRPPQ